MQPTTLLTTLLALTTSSLALPTSEAKRDNHGSTTVRLCTGIDFTGFCQNFENTFDTCINIPQPLFRSIGSIDPGNNALCGLTTSADTCAPYGDLIINEGPVTNLYNFKGENVGNSATSFQCRECAECP